MEEGVLVRIGEAHWKWLNVILLFIITCVTFGITDHTRSLFIVPVCTEMGLSRTDFGLFNVISTVVGLLLSLGFAKILRLVGRIKVLLMLGSLSAAIHMALFGLAPNLWVLYLVGMIKGGFVAFISVACVSLFLSRWFTEKRGVVMGMVMAGTGLGGTIFSPLVSLMIGRLGWRSTALLCGLLLLLVAVPAALLLRESPASRVRESASAAGSDRQSGLSVAEGVHASFFWVGLLGVMMAMMASNFMASNVAAILDEKGLATALASAVMSLQFAVNTGAKLVIGASLDRFGARLTITGILCCMFAAGCCLLGSASLPLAFAYGAFYGVAFAISSSPVAIFVETLFGPRNYSVFIGYYMAAYHSGVILAPLVSGWVYDHTGSYDGAILVAIALSVGALILFNLALTLARRRRKEAVHSA